MESIQLHHDIIPIIERFTTSDIHSGCHCCANHIDILTYRYIFVYSNIDKPKSFFKGLCVEPSLTGRQETVLGFNTDISLYYTASQFLFSSVVHDCIHHCTFPLQQPFIIRFFFSVLTLFIFTGFHLCSVHTYYMN